MLEAGSFYFGVFERIMGLKKQEAERCTMKKQSGIRGSNGHIR
jgi:hypothetical protein